jgi:octaprenyl-diphosphate synthase
LPEVLTAIHGSGSLEYSRKAAEHYALAAEGSLAQLPVNEWSQALRALTRYAIDRNH